MQELRKGQPETALMEFSERLDRFALSGKDPDISPDTKNEIKSFIKEYCRCRFGIEKPSETETEALREKLNTITLKLRSSKRTIRA